MVSNWPPSPTRLSGPKITLEPLSRDHIDGLQQAVLPGRLWEGPFGFAPHPDSMAQYVERALDEADQKKSLPFTVRLNEQGDIVGSTRFRNIQEKRRRMEIGFTWY